MAKQGERGMERATSTRESGNGADREDGGVSPGAPTPAEESRLGKEFKPSLEALEGDVPAPVPAGTPVEKRCEELRKKPIEDLTADELQLQIGQRIGLDHLVPAALDVLEREPLVEGGYYPGDLLGTVLRLDRDFWTEHRALHERCVAVLERVQAPEEIEEEVQDFPRSLV
jgi:hypothetical protein